MSRFFIGRPIFAAVIAIIITLAGLVASQVLPVAQYPEITPPTVTISATFPGASADTLAKTLAAPIEEQLSGIEGLLYFNSTASSSGNLTITLTFEVGTNVDSAVINTNNRVQAALPRLPDDVRRTGVLVQKRSTDILMFIALKSNDPRYDTLYLSNYATLNMVDAIKRLPGVADSTIFGARDFGMRIWLRPDRMAQLGVTTADIASAIRSQNAQFAAGKIGQEPSPGQSIVYTVTTRGRLVEPEEFGNIVLRASASGGTLRLKDVARVELGAQNYDVNVTVNGAPSIGIGVYLQSGANALAVAEIVRRAVTGMSKNFPTGVDYVIPFDTTKFVQASIHEVIVTLVIAALLVVLVVFMFLQSWRATLIPIIVVPVALIGAFAGLYVFGFSINTLTLFAIVLATGIVVDDAIVVLENVERLMAEKNLSPREAAIESMREVTGAIIAIELVLVSVFVPIAFLGGIAGQLYKQFAVTVATSVTISGIAALTLTPALCALLLKSAHKESALFRPFNRGFERLTSWYGSSVRWSLKNVAASIAIFAAVLVAIVWLMRVVPTSFVPPEDQGYVFGSIVLPDGASLNRTGKVGATVQQLLNKHPAVENVFMISGFDLLGGGQKTNAATTFIALKPWDQRETTSQQVVEYLLREGASIRDASVISFGPPAIRGLGTSGGIEAYLQNRSSDDPQQLAKVLQQFLEELRRRPELASVNSFFRPGVPQIQVEVDREKALSLGVPITDVYEALQTEMGGFYVNDFNRSGRTYRVMLQAEAAFRSRPENLGSIYVRAAGGDMIPLKVLIRLKSTVGADQLDRYNGFVAAKFIANAASSTSSGQAIAVVEEVAAKVLPQGYSVAWTGAAFQEQRTGSASILAFSLALVLVFLILAAQYERWTLPVAVLLSVPFALLGALVAVLMRGFTNDIYFQIGLVVLIGLAAKNAILIVEFAAQNLAKGMSTFDAALTAARQRFRPIVMTSLAFVLGVLPLVIAQGAGAGARRSMGTGVLGGMLAATFIATIFVPVFFDLLSRRYARRKDEAAKREEALRQEELSQYEAPPPANGDSA
jgi:multidrug efflux pump